MRCTAPRAAVARLATSVTAVVASVVPVLAATRRVPPTTSGRVPAWLPAVVATGAAAAYAASVGRAQARAVGDPAATTARAATIAGIRGMVPLQSGLLAAAGEAGAAVALGAATYAARSVARSGSPT